MRPLIIPTALITGLVALSACGDHTSTPGTSSSTAPDSSSAPASTDKTQATAPAADNSGANAQDRRDHPLTPLDQGNNAEAIAITQAIRQALVADHDLSVNARNIKIISNNQIVTLRGPVANVAERDRVLQIAKAVPGVEHISDQLAITAPK